MPTQSKLDKYDGKIKKLTEELVKEENCDPKKLEKLIKKQDNLELKRKKYEDKLSKNTIKEINNSINNFHKRINEILNYMTVFMNKYDEEKLASVYGDDNNFINEYTKLFDKYNLAYNLINQLYGIQGKYIVEDDGKNKQYNDLCDSMNNLENEFKTFKKILPKKLRASISVSVKKMRISKKLTPLKPHKTNTN